MRVASNGLQVHCIGGDDGQSVEESLKQRRARFHCCAKQSRSRPRQSNQLAMSGPT
jgi:hypothetical protein